MSFWESCKLLIVPQSAHTEMIRAPLQRSSEVGDSSSSNTSVKEKKVSDPSSEEVIEVEREDQVIEVKNIKDTRKTSPIDWLIRLITRWGGTIYMFILMWLVTILWIIYGILSKGSDQWQISMQDGQSIQTYYWDTLLMRQQLDDSAEFLRLFGVLNSRATTHLRLLEKIKTHQRETLKMSDAELVANLKNEDAKFSDESRVVLKNESKYDVFCTKMAAGMGSLVSVVVFWCLVFVWIGCGALKTATGDDDENGNPIKKKFSDEWQMYVNTGVAVLLMISSIVLENIRLRNDLFIKQQIKDIITFDASIERLEREITGDYTPNEIISVVPLKRKGLKKVISKYADIIGTGLGLLISVCVFVVWLAIGNVMGWSDNWWLIIGTYTGLIGFIDGFVLREVYFSITKYEEKDLTNVLQQSIDVLRAAGIDADIPEIRDKNTISFRVSKGINYVCSNQWSVVGSVIAVLALIIIASGLKWSVTGQLICNTPTMIVEEFFLLILLQAHGWADTKRRRVMDQLRTSRELVYKYVASVYKYSDLN
ncbi:unnamed protein product [Ambrosiozyma monospora]|uniref:Unnamed protein product n=1 Tax=Ambrosiozyma monospora TaxID=43982 RepID=A0A9W6YSI6_AMBMO|nr:unnamed protein product [Ambrosiozyma monospora]